MSSTFYFISDKIAADNFKDGMTPSLKANYGLKFAQDVALNRVREKVKPRCKMSYKLLNEEYLYDPLLDIAPYSTLFQFKYDLDGIHHCVTVIDKWYFESNFPFVLPLTKENLDYCCINDNETKRMNFYKGVLKSIFSLKI